MMNKISSLIKLVLLLLILSGVLLNISARGCVKRSSSKIGSSNNNSFTINAPSGLTATAVSYSQINLSWQDNSNNEDGFEIERSFNGTDYLLLTTVYSNVTSYSNTGLSQFTTYYYRVRSLNTIGDRSEWSNIASVTTFSVWARAVAGGYHTLALTTDGRVWAWGLNIVGQLGLGDTTYTKTDPPVADNLRDRPA
jgi:hypothetical protein